MIFELARLVVCKSLSGIVCKILAMPVSGRSGDGDDDDAADDDACSASTAG